MAAVAEHLVANNRKWIDGLQLTLPGNPQSYEFLRIGIGQRAQQHGVENREDSHVAADTQRQRKDGCNTESGILDHHAAAKADILPQG